MTPSATGFGRIAPQPGMLAVDSFLFLRHGRTGHNLRQIVQGHLDIPLDAAGRAEARAAASLLAGEGPVPRIVSSDLSRAHETALGVAGRLQLPLLVEPDLRERCFGPFQGQPAPGSLWDMEVEGMETMAAFAGRVMAALVRHVKVPDTLIVAHGGVLRAIARLLDAELPEGALRNAVPLRFHRLEQRWEITKLERAGVVLPSTGTLEPL